MTLEQLISEIQIKGSFGNDSYFTTSEYASIINGEIKTQITPLLLKLSEDYLLSSKEYAISSSITNYQLPSRAIGSKVRDVKVKDPSGNYIDLLRLFEEDRSSDRSGYYINRNSIELSDDITSGTLVVSFYLRPSSLVASGSYAIISNVDTGTNTVTVQSLPSTFLVGSACDFVQSNSPFDLLGYDNAITGINALDITFSSLPENLAEGDYLCLASQSPVAQIPDELNQLLIQAALVKCLAAKKDKAVEYEITVMKMIKEDLVNMLDPRSESNDVKIRPQGLLRRLVNR